MSMASELLSDYYYEMDYPFGRPNAKNAHWVTRDGKEIPVCKMGTAHIMDCMRMVGEDDEWYWCFMDELNRMASDENKLR